MMDGEPPDSGPADSGSDAAALPGTSAGYRWTVTSVARRHKRVAAGALAVVVAVIAVTLITTVSSSARRQPFSDAASCTQWAAGTRGQKLAYAHLYIDEYGRFADTARNAARVEAAIDRACTKASYLGEADDLSVLAGIRHAF